jgi:hypothetical protein
LDRKWFQIATEPLTISRFRVVATLAKKDEDAVPVRVVVVLAPDQNLTLSTPHEAGAPADAVEIIRRADTVLIHEAAAGLTN